MFEKLMGAIDMMKYNIIVDDIYEGNEELMSAEFVSDLIYKYRANHYLYITLKVSEKIYKSRFFIFGSISGRTMFILDSKGDGSKFIDEVALTYLN